MLKRLFCTLVFSVMSLNVYSARIDVKTAEEGYRYAMITGKIEQGDGDNFKSMINNTKKKSTMPKRLFLDSPGGDLYESYLIMEAILDNRLSTFVVKGAHCESACVGILASGHYRYIDPESYVGVHRVSVEGEETDYSRGISVSLMQIYKELEIPEHVRLKMVETEPDDMYYLTRAEKEELSHSNPNFASAEGAVMAATIPEVSVLTNPKQARELNALGITAIQNKNYGDAVNSLEEAKALSPSDAEILGNLGYAYYLNKQYPEAKDVLISALSVKVDRGATWNNLGLVLIQLGEDEWAVDCFINYWEFSANKKAATNQFFYWEEKKPGTLLDRVSKKARASLGIVTPIP